MVAEFDTLKGFKMDDTLLPSVEAFLLLHGMAPRTLGMEALKDASFVDDLRKGREARRDTARRVRDFMVAKDRERAGATKMPADSGLFGEDTAA